MRDGLKAPHMASRAYWATYSQTNICSDYRGRYGIDIRVPELYWETSSREQEKIESGSILFTTRHSEYISKLGNSQIFNFIAIGCFK